MMANLPADTPYAAPQEAPRLPALHGNRAAAAALLPNSQAAGSAAGAQRTRRAEQFGGGR
jgi:hypothetical protein